MSSSMVTPTVILDGSQVVAQYGDNVYAIPAGPHQVDIYSQWLRRYGQASIVADVPVNGWTRVFYALPWHQFTSGSLGYEKQPRKGVGFLVGLLVFILVFLVVLPLLVIVLLG